MKINSRQSLTLHKATYRLSSLRKVKPILGSFQHNEEHTNQYSAVSTLHVQVYDQTKLWAPAAASQLQ
jgi:hypothetical protein